jgi:prolyl-tRNA synthetase
MAGVYSFLPLGLRVMDKIENIICEEMDSLGGQKLLLPTLHPKENWVKTGRWDAMDDLYKVEDASGRQFGLGPTHEEVVVPLAQKYVNSYKDFPFAVYQVQNKFRMELRAKSGLMRGREFFMKDLYSFHLKQEDMDQYYEKAKAAYVRIFEKAGIGAKTHITFASGGTFAKYSHEFQTISEAGEDIIYVCQKCGIAINKEIREETPACPECGGTDFTEEKAIETGNIFKLSDKFTKPFGFEMADEKGEKSNVIMGCYGIGLNRLMGTAVELFHDEKGIIWPENIAPYTVHLLNLGQDEEAEKIYTELEAKGIEVLFDDRNAQAGEKFADSDLIGIPWRVVVSKKSLAAGGIEVKKRSESESEIMTVEEFLKTLKK